jgi:hypothetical protein
MQYKSIIRFFKHLQPEVSNFAEVDPQRLKKLTNAEFSQAPGGIMMLDDLEYNRQDILTFFDHDDLAKCIYYEHVIFTHEDLLYLLEEHVLINGPEELQWYALMEDEGLLKYLSPYFAHAFSKVMGAYIQEANYHHASLWYPYIRMVVPDDQELANNSIRSFLLEGERLFRNLNEKTYVDSYRSLLPWKEAEWGSFVNQVYDEFAMQIEDLTVEMINFTVRIQQENADLSFYITEELLKVTKLSPEHRRIVEGNHRVFAKNRGPAGVKLNNILSKMYFIAIFLYFITRVGCF